MAFKKLADVAPIVAPPASMLNNADEAVRHYVERMEERRLNARAELTLAAAYAELLPPATTNRAAIIARIRHALTELGGPLDMKKEQANEAD